MRIVSTLGVWLAAAAAAGAVAACTHTVKVEPIKVEPIDITLHIYLEADKKLDSFFGDGTPAPAATPPTTPEGSPK
jgi:hypothetical protein